MSEFVTKEELDAKLTSLVDAQMAREDNNARMLFGQLNTLRIHISNLEDRLHQLENPSEPEEAPEPVDFDNVLNQLAKPLEFNNIYRKANEIPSLEGKAVYQILGNQEGSYSDNRYYFFGLVSTEDRARVAVMTAAQHMWFPNHDINDIIFLSVGEGMWTKHQNLTDAAIVYVHASGLRARRASQLYEEVYAEKRELDAPLEKETL